MYENDYSYLPRAMALIMAAGAVGAILIGIIPALRLRRIAIRLWMSIPTIFILIVYYYEGAMSRADLTFYAHVILLIVAVFFTIIWGAAALPCFALSKYARYRLAATVPDTGGELV